MSEWHVTNKYKKTVETHELWEKDDMTIRRITVWRNGSWNVETNDSEEPQFDFDSGPAAHAVDMNFAINDNIISVELNELVDGCSDDVIWPDDMSSEERDRMEELWDECQDSSWEEDGWELVDSECWVSGGVDVERIEE